MILFDLYMLIIQFYKSWLSFTHPFKYELYFDTLCHSIMTSKKFDYYKNAQVFLFSFLGGNPQVIIMKILRYHFFIAMSFDIYNVVFLNYLLTPRWCSKASRY